MQKAGTKMTVKKPMLPSINNSIAQSTLATIPTTVPERREFLETWLERYKNGWYECPAIGKRVIVTADSIEETARHAAKSRASTVCAMMLPEIIFNAVKVSKDKPHSNKQIKVFEFKEMFILKVHVKYYGDAKLTVGKTMRGRRIEYCITSLKFTNRKEISPCETHSPKQPLNPQRLIKRKGSNKKSTSKKNNKK